MTIIVEEFSLPQCRSASKAVGERSYDRSFAVEDVETQPRSLVWPVRGKGENMRGREIKEKNSPNPDCKEGKSMKEGTPYSLSIFLPFALQIYCV